MGGRIARALLDKKSFEIVGAVDVNPKLVGRDLGEALELGRKLGVTVEKDAAAVFARSRADAAVHATSSHLKTVFPQLASCLEAGLDVVSTCEELSFPWKRHPDLSRDLDALARKCDATVVGTGINPGYLMDTLPAVLTAPCLRVDAVQVTRMMNSAKRRIPFQEKVGTALTPAQFQEKIRTGAITGHVGLQESIHMIAAALDWTLEGVTELAPEPVLADRDVQTAVAVVKPGNVIGLKSVAYGSRDGRKAVTLEFVAHAAVAEEYDEVVIRGEPDVRQRILGGVHGDVGTVAMTINTLPRALAAPAGLKTMIDLAVPRAVP
jgi:4-hydroxy-tetrahydrodipicolinate reductase